MQIFVNELSLEGQYQTLAQFTEAIRIFTAIFDQINLQTRQDQVLYDKVYLNRDAVKSDLFVASFSQVRNRQLRVAFRDAVFNRPNPKPIDWRTEQQHSVDDLFECLEDDVANTSVAELSERIISQTTPLGLLINFKDSKFQPHNPITVVKNEQEDVSLPSVETVTQLQDWYERTFQLSQMEYADSSTVPPRDGQTVLRDGLRFKQTGKRFQGRMIYREAATGHYWYVDNLHFGLSAEIEVCDSVGDHIGVASIDGEVDYSQGKVGRSIKNLL